MRTIGFPGRYLQGPGAIGHLPELLKEFGMQSTVVVMDDIVRTAAGNLILEPLRKAGIKVKLLRFPGECSAAAIAEMSKAIDPYHDELIIGFGGGKTIDATKGVAKANDLNLIIVPTIASNDSPTSRLIVLYDDAHRVVAVDKIVRNPDVVLVDSNIVAKAPVRFFAAGIGDALSKKFEAHQCHLAGGTNFFGTQSLSTARLLADKCYETILAFGLPALDRIRSSHTPDETVERVIEATVLLSGLGFESGGLSISHALTRGFTAHAGMSKALHGELVAFGSIVQLLAEDRPEAEVLEHALFCHRANLPVTLTQLGGAPASPADLLEMGSLTMTAPYIGNISPPASASRLADCIRRADIIGQKLIHASN